MVKRRNRQTYSVLFFLCTVSLIPSFVHAQSKYWIEFRDKGITSATFVSGNSVFEGTRASLSPKCLQRRSHAMNEDEAATITIEDAPIFPPYLDSLRMRNVRICSQSKWSNAVSGYLDAFQIKQISALGFVRAIHPVGIGNALSTQPTAATHRNPHPSSRILHPLSSDSACGYDPVIYEYGGSQSQLDRINIWPLHAMGFDGSGVLLGWLDDGMYWQSASSIEHIHLISQYDYILHDSIVYDQPGDSSYQDDHGTTTLSTGMGYLPDTLMGPAFNADVMLAETENASSERNIEEDNYANALEDMEARGVEITSSSLGYFTFDSGQHSYTYADMNGQTAICTRAVERAAKLGVLVCTAMGNGAQTGYPNVVAPADADSILACGALDVDDSIAGFSSLGPTYDGRTKPDICAPGVNIWIQHPYSILGTGSGTSYATPLTSSSCALIKQAHPEATAQEIRHAVMMTGANAANPNDTIGWGEINAYAAALALGPIANIMNASFDTRLHICAGAASQDGISDVEINYYSTIEGGLHTVPLSLVEDSLIYSGESDSITIPSTVFFRVVAHDSAGNEVTSPSSGWDVLSSGSSPLNVFLYPNPAVESFQITVTEPGNWSLFDQVGKRMLSGTVSSGTNEATISTEGLSSGIYYLQFVAPSGEMRSIPVVVYH